MLIMLWVTDELSYDKWNEKYERIYRPVTEVNFGGSHRHFAVSTAPMAAALINDFPEVETSVRLRDIGSTVVSTPDSRIAFEEEIIRTDSSIFEVFSLNLLQGNSQTALAAPNTAVIASSLAQKLFPNDNPMGKTIILDSQNKFMVNGIIEDIPVNSHFNKTIFVTLTGNAEAENPLWLSNNFHTYYVLREGVDAKAFEAKVYPYFIKQYVAPQLETVMGKPYEDFLSTGAFVKYTSQPLSSIHLESDLEAEIGTNGNLQYVWLFSIAALFILLIACVNFMNLSTARSANRAKEIGVRKVLGSLRMSLIKQFLVEAILMTAIAFVVGLCIATVSLPYFNDLADKELSLPFTQIPFWLVLLGGIGLVGLLAGSYPAFYLSAFRPIQTLSGKLREKGGNVNLRNSLVVVQFLIAAFMIIGTLGIQKQLNFIQQKKLGFEREQVLILDNCEALGDDAFTLKDKMLRNSTVSNATVTGFLPVPSYRSDSPLCKHSEVREDNCVSIQVWQVDENYIPLFEMEVVAGRNFSTEMGTDSNAVIINESAAKLFGFDDPIGKTIYGSTFFDPTSGAPLPAQKIIGVVKDFHYESMRENIGPVSLWLNPYPGNITLKVQTEDISGLIANLEADWKSIAPAIPFSYRFMDDSFDKVYRSESRIGKIFSIFSGLCILIACLGLFGLAAFTVERRVKEIGIRKVLGASTISLVSLLSKDFLKLVIVALVIAIPLAWYFMQNWMANFAYQTQISWWLYAVAGIIAILIAFATVSFQSVKAAMANPVDSIKAD